MSAMPTLDEVLDFVRRVSALTGPIAGEERREVPRHYLELYALYDRGRSMLAAIRILLERGFVHEAMILSRPLLTDSLAFAELAASDEQRRATLLIGWERQGLATLRGIAVEAQRGGMSGFDPVISFVDQRMTDIETYAGEKGFVGSRHWEPDKSAKAPRRNTIASPSTWTFGSPTSSSTGRRSRHLNATRKTTKESWSVDRPSRENSGE
jgi:hypothetical protein